MAHSPSTAFHAAHLALLAELPNLHVVSVHGFSGSGVEVADGTSRRVAPDSPTARIARVLAKSWTDEPVTTCNGYEGAADDGVTVLPRLCGVWCVQGRAVNKIADACDALADAQEVGSATFVHLEQSRAVRADERKVGAIIAALREAIPD
jgi:hypothetical protein